MELWLTRAETHKLKLRYQYQGTKPALELRFCWGLCVGNSESSKLQEDLGMAEDLQEVNQMPTENIRELSPWASSR